MKLFAINGALPMHKKICSQWLLGMVCLLVVSYSPSVVWALAYTSATIGLPGQTGNNSDPTHAITTFSHSGPASTPIVDSGALRATAEADLTGNTKRVLAVEAAGILHKPTGPGYSGSIGHDIEATAGFADTWTFSRACLGGPCTTPWEFTISTNITGGLDANSLLPPRATYFVEWGGFAPTRFAGNAETGFNLGNVRWIWEGEQSVNETATWTWVIPSVFETVTLLPQAELFAQARLLSGLLLENEEAVIRSGVGFLNSAGFTLSLPSDVTFSSLSGVTPLVSSVPEPASFLLLASGLAGVGFWRWKVARP